ncbi:radical SAM family heme chaperone HemW [Treponema parvum]|uniref:Heme chaperone HemW n=1 Tax=Treponema parvum TaxID=138851 RepID=A0A975EZR8_9SPIR|nr:radical SAM family heme chaperone HemW [Treponema parvum]QTQ11733.1 radical SAM family heme chaperone HemW [Treponema parvum]
MSGSVSLYIHIPFCKKKCGYCDFFSVECALNKIPDEYIRAVIFEAEFYAKKYGVDSWRTVYIGGGTPSLMTSSQILSLLKGISRTALFPAGCEITVEMNPDDVSPDLLFAAEDAGVNRLSVGIQTFDDEILKGLGRRCTKDINLAALNLIQKKWKRRFSADLIAGFPQESKKQLKQNISTLMSFCPDHISLYALSVEKKTPLGKEILSGRMPYDYGAADSCWICGRNFLEKNGYPQYEVSNFSKPEFESAHNKVYWRLENYVGVGAGASGAVYSCRNSSEEGVRWTNTADIGRYISFWNEVGVSNFFHCENLLKSARNTEILDLKTQEFEFLMMGLRLRAGINSSVYKKRFGGDLGIRLGDFDGGCFYRWEKKKLALRRTGDNLNPGINYALSSKGLLFLNSFLESLL